jgi:DNA polymerase-3 subunit epsilon
MQKLILDTETTGLEPHAGDRICEIAVLQLIPGTGGKSYTRFHTRLNPEREVPEGAARINGLSLELLKDEPKFAYIARDLLRLLIGNEIIMHNADFDIGFLEAEYTRLSMGVYGFLRATSQVTCTRAMARSRLPGIKHSLDSLCDHYRIDRSGRAIHSAVLDCQLLGQVYHRLSAEHPPLPE